jgi:hypothetical protein
MYHINQINKLWINSISEADVDSGVDENTQQGDGSPKTGSAGSRIPRRTPPESPMKARYENGPTMIRTGMVG